MGERPTTSRAARPVLVSLTVRGGSLQPRSSFPVVMVIRSTGHRWSMYFCAVRSARGRFGSGSCSVGGRMIATIGPQIITSSYTLSQYVMDAFVAQ